MAERRADIFRAEARFGSRPGHKAVIHIYLGCGPPQQDLWDLKMEAPAEIRSEFKPIATKVRGVQTLARKAGGQVDSLTPNDHRARKAVWSSLR